MAQRKSSKAPYIVILLLGTAIAGLLLYIVPYRYQLNHTEVFRETDEALDNPLTGYAPNAELVEECEDSRLVYIGIPWSLWEPSEGNYNIEGIEELFHIQRWKEENKHAVLRFLCDIPGEAGHMDIPAWLYEETRDGSFYETSYGAGYSPDYSNAYFLERHGMALEALAEYFNEDDFLAYVELGSLGHWGEWHTNTDEGVPPLPDAQVCWEYVLDYSDNFHNARLLMRRNYVMAEDGGMGLFNDMTGSQADTQEWLEWIQDGGSFDTAGAALAYEPMPDFWKTAPSGGEFTSMYPMEEMLGDRLVETLEMIRDTHMTFIGPKCPEGDLKDSTAAGAVREELGYRYYISQLETQYSFTDGTIQVRMTWENSGLAPIYWDWPATMYVYDIDDELLYWESIAIDLTELLPGETITTTTSIPFTDRFRQGFSIGVGITNPEEDDTIRLAMDVEFEDGIHRIYEYSGE